MDLALVAELNRLRAARVPVIAVHHLERGDVQLVTEDHLSGHALREALQGAFRKGSSATLSGPDGEVFLRVYMPAPRLICVGAVHISQALVPMAQACGLDVTVIDPRTAFATDERFPGVPLLADWPETVMPDLAVDRFTAIAALTHVPDIDDFALLHALARDCFYIGALGSRKTNAKRLDRLAKDGASPDQLERIRAPIGLNIGAASPAEIAVSILAEVIAALRQRQVG